MERKFSKFNLNRRDIEVFNYARQATQYRRQVTANNRLPPALEWMSQQPAHFDTAGFLTTHNIASKLGAWRNPTYWDGTMNQPTMGLAHPLHKDSASALLS